MNKYINIFSLATVLLITATACNRDEVFKREQYKNVFAIVSGSDNVYMTVHDLRLPESTGYISASLGGSNLCDRDIVITMVEDADVLNMYNKSLFQEDRERYVQALTSDKYYFNGYTMTIHAGETKASLPVNVKPTGLSPDSVRYIPLRVDTYSTGELNLEKGGVLYEVRTKNWWCIYSGTNYVSRGIRYESIGAPLNIYVNKSVYPIGPATVRMMAGNESEKDANGSLKYKGYAMLVDISDETVTYNIDGVPRTCSPVTIRPYGTLDVEPVIKGDYDYDANYPNIADDRDDDGYRTYKTLRLHYRFTESNGTEVRIKEELRFEYIEDLKDPRFLNN